MLSNGLTTTGPNPAPTWMQACGPSGRAAVPREFLSPVFFQPAAGHAPAELLSFVEFMSPPSGAAAVPPYLATSAGLSCLTSHLTRAVHQAAGAVVRIGRVSATATTRTTAGQPVVYVDLTFQETVSAGPVQETVPVSETLALFARQGALVGLYGIDLPPADAGVYTQQLYGLVTRSHSV